MLFVDAVSFSHGVAPAGMFVATVVERRAKCGIFSADESACCLVEHVIADIEKMADFGEIFGFVMLYPLVFPDGTVGPGRHHFGVVDGLDELPKVQSVDAQTVLKIFVEFFFGAPIEERHGRADHFPFFIDENGSVQL